MNAGAVGGGAPRLGAPTAGFKTELTDMDRRKYVYTKLDDANETDAEYNVYGVVVNFVRSRSSKGSHKFYASYTVIDDSRPTIKSAVSVNIFANDLKNLPEPTHIGTILRFHRLKLQYFNNAPQLVGRLAEVNPMTNKPGHIKGNTTSSLLCMRKTHYLTSIPLYFDVQSKYHLNSVENPCFVAAATVVANDAASSGNSDRREGVNSSSAAAVVTSTESPSDATATVGVAPITTVTTAATVDPYAYFNLNEWLIQNPQPGCQNTFRQTDMARLVELNLWSELQFMNQISLNDGLILNNACAESLSQVITARSQMSQFIESKFDVVCMVAFVLPPGEGKDKVTLYVYDGSNAGATGPAAAVAAGPGPIVQELIESTPETELLGPRYVSTLCEHMYLGMSNAALFSECKTVTDKRLVEATLDNGDSLDLDLGNEQQNDNVVDRGAVTVDVMILGDCDGDGGNAPAPAHAPAHQEKQVQVHLLHGQLYRIECASTEESDYVTRILKLEPGMWVRIRSLHTTPEVYYNNSSSNSSSGAGSGASSSSGNHTVLPCAGVIHNDTGVGILQPYFYDATKIASRYFHHQLYLQQQQLQQQQTQTQGQGQGQGQGQAQGQGKVQPQQQQQCRRTLRSALGFDYIPLASCLSSTPPAEFCCRLQIVDFYPHDVSQFVRMLPATETSPARPVFMFSLCVADSSGQTDVVCFGEDAQFLFGGLSPVVFMENDSVQQAVEMTLFKCMGVDPAVDADGMSDANAMETEAGTGTGTGADVVDLSMDFYLWSYRVPVRDQKEDGKHQYTTRIKVVHTALFSFDEVSE